MINLACSLHQALISQGGQAQESVPWSEHDVCMPSPLPFFIETIAAMEIDFKIEIIHLNESDLIYSSIE